jgi:PAS domain S-box-containing protein
MDIETRHSGWTDFSAPMPMLALVSLVFVVCYQVDRLVYVLAIPPSHVASFWPSTAFLVAVLLLVPRKIWASLIASGLMAMALSDLKNGVPISYEIWITIGNLTETLIAAFGINYLLNGTARLSNWKTLIRYLAFAVIFVPFTSAVMGSIGSEPGGYLLQWRIWFFADALAFLTVTPAVLHWVHEGRSWARKPLNFLEFAALLASLFFLGYLTFISAGRVNSSALLYFIVPILLWAALRPGLKGVSTSIVVIAFITIWGTANGRGPFSDQGPLNDALSLQLFLFFAAIPFTVLAVVVEEQKQIQNALIAEEAELSEAQHVAEIGSWQWEPQSDTVTWSRELYRIAGRDPKLAAPNFKEHALLYTLESMELLRYFVDEALRNGTPYELDMEMVHTDGSKKWIRARGQAVRDDLGRVVGLRGTAQDINDRMHIEKELAEVNDRLRLAMEAGKLAGWDTDIRTDRHFWFGDLKSIYGIPYEAYVAGPEDFYRSVHPEDRERVLAAVQDAKTNKKPYSEEFRSVRADGTVRWVSAKGKFYYSPQGEPERMLGIKVDITDRKHAENSLRESEELLRLAAQAGKMFAFDWNLQTDVITRSGEGAHILDLPGDPTGFATSELVARIHPEDRAAFLRAISEPTPKSPDNRLTYRLMRPDGSIRWLERTGHAIFDGQGKMVRMIGMVADITERKLAEEALSKVGGRLIEAHEVERAWIARELHDDIGQQLALLANNLELMEKDPADSAADIRGRIHEQLKRVNKISADVQGVSHRLHSSKLQYLGIVAAAKSFCQELSEQHKVEIAFTHADIPPVLPEEISLCLFRVMQEALQNAVKHSGVRLFEVNLRGDGGWIQLTVHDAGLGFDPQSLSKSRGLGHVSMEERVHLQKGTFSIESALNQGTTVRVRVPVGSEEASMGAAG